MTSSLRAVAANNKTVDLAGKVAVVVGGTSGIGEGIAYRLADAKAHVVIVGRNKERGEAIASECKTRSGGEKGSFVQCDASILGNVKGCAKSIEELLPDKRLDILVESQGIATVAGYTPTSEGIEQKLAIHYYSRCAFVEALSPNLMASDNPIVLTVLSAGVHSPFTGYRDDTDLEKTFSIVNAANACGFYNDLAVDWLAERHAPIKFVHACPGLVDTNWGNEMPMVLKGLVRMMQKIPGLVKSKADCAEFMCTCIFRPQEEIFKDGKGFYLMNQYGGQAKPTNLHSAEARAFMQAHTLKLLDKLMKE
eukprot:gene506-1915_t